MSARSGSRRLRNCSALPFSGETGTNAFGRTIIRHPKDDSFSLLELDGQCGGVHHIELTYAKDGADSNDSGRPQLTSQWSDEVKDLEKTGGKLAPRLWQVGQKGASNGRPVGVVRE